MRLEPCSCSLGSAWGAGVRCGMLPLEHSASPRSAWWGCCLALHLCRNMQPSFAVLAQVCTGVVGESACAVDLHAVCSPMRQAFDLNSLL